MCFSTHAMKVERKQSFESEKNDGMIPLNHNQCNVYFNVQCLINALLTVRNTLTLWQLTIRLCWYLYMQL